MKRKAKRFDEGGEAELKKRGLEESKNEKVGFFERLRMGNIDKPGSEAYEKFGAGRGRAAQTKEREVEASKSGPMGVKPEYTGTRFGQSMPEVSRTEDKEPVKESEPDSVAGKGARNLALEDDTPSPVKKAMKVVGEKKIGAGAKTLPGKPNDKAKPQNLPGKPEAKTEPTPYSGARTRAGTPVSSRKEPTEEEKASGRKFSEEKLKKQREDFENTPLMRALTGGGGRSEYYKKKREAEESRYAKGGKVSSASKRADGIAMRGKTRGRMV